MAEGGAAALALDPPRLDAVVLAAALRRSDLPTACGDRAALERRVARLAEDVLRAVADGAIERVHICLSQSLDSHLAAAMEDARRRGLRMTPGTTIGSCRLTGIRGDGTAVSLRFEVSGPSGRRGVPAWVQEWVVRHDPAMCVDPRCGGCGVPLAPEVGVCPACGRVRPDRGAWQVVGFADVAWLEARRDWMLGVQRDRMAGAANEYLDIPYVIPHRPPVVGAPVAGLDALEQELPGFDAVVLTQAGAVVCGAWLEVWRSHSLAALGQLAPAVVTEPLARRLEDLRRRERRRQVGATAAAAVRLTGVSRTPRGWSATVTAQIEGTDREVAPGTPEPAVDEFTPFTLDMEFVRDAKGRRAVTCPACGAGLRHTVFGVCRYCGNRVELGSDWTLARIDDLQSGSADGGLPGAAPAVDSPLAAQARAAARELFIRAHRRSAGDAVGPAVAAWAGDAAREISRCEVVEISGPAGSETAVVVLESSESAVIAASRPRRDILQLARSDLGWSVTALRRDEPGGGDGPGRGAPA